MAAVSSRLTFKLSAPGAAYFIASPSWVRLVLVVVKVLASTSDTRPDSPAARLNPDIMLDDTSAVVARSMPPAAARSSIPGMAAFTDSGVKPAMLRNDCPAATSLALNEVVRPSSLACPLSISICSAEAPLRAFTLLMAASKPMAVRTEATTGAAMAMPWPAVSSI